MTYIFNGFAALVPAPVKKSSEYFILSKDKYERGPCFHCLRHVFVLKSFKQLAAKGISIDNSIPYLSIYLGHSNLMQTEHYMKFTCDMFEDEFQKFANYSANVFPEVHYEEEW